jgi:glycosyltransferase involved in cell wall biosynthesis
MKVLHLAAGNRWTGAAAPAFAEVAALREAGIDAHYAYVGGYRLQNKIGRLDFSHPIIVKAQNPLSFFRSMESIQRLIDHHGFDVLHAHLTYDHWLARLAARDWTTPIARTFHSGRVLRRDPLTRSLIAHASLICVVNEALSEAGPIRERSPLFTPPPIDRNQFRPEGTNVRDFYGIPRQAVVVAAIGKLSPGRGFELVLQTFAALQRQLGNSRLMIIGDGEHRPALEALARELGIAGDVVWAGYQEDDLAAHYRAADFLLFTAKGSDEGHRAVLEAMACATVPITWSLPGLHALLHELSTSLIVPEPTAENLASCILTRIDDLGVLRPKVVERSSDFAYPRAAARLIAAYSRIL